MNKTLDFLKTTAIGGLLFLLPLIVIGALIGQVVPIVLSVAESLGDVIPVKTPGGIALLVLLAIVIVLLLCFGAGLLARWSLGRRISKSFEKNILLLFPRYAILKDQMANSIGGDENKPQMKPVLARFDDSVRLGFEIERTDAGLVAVYLPGARRMPGRAVWCTSEPTKWNTRRSSSVMPSRYARGSVATQHRCWPARRVTLLQKPLMNAEKR